ncbi:PKD domain-containing protein [Nocardioides zeae]|uniref:PKD domain-containing protein n=1 Tax=Nocardioides zeae TaxID=1457234 RepID=UPI00286CB981|nr:PKD domain-containing protein [Nocardioides zeae]
MAATRGPSKAQIQAARQAYVDNSICLPTAIIGLGLGNLCAGRVACDETTLDTYLQNPYLATGTGRPSNCTPTPGQDPTAVINAAVYQAFRDVPLPQTVLQIQPPDGTTLVNLETNFFTNAEPFTTTVTVLGYTVELDITPTTYTWDFGDGTTTTTTTPGAPYPDLDITHVYTRTGTYPTTLTTTWSADFRVDGRDWQRVQGTVDMPSPTLDLQVREATPVLTG